MPTGICRITDDEIAAVTPKPRHGLPIRSEQLMIAPVGLPQRSHPVRWSLCHQSGWGIVFSGDRQATNFTLVALAPKSDVKRYSRSSNSSGWRKV